MTRKGEPSKAIGYAVTCSAIGGTLSAILMMIATEPIADFAISTFGPVEITALIFFGLTVVAGVGSKSLAKGWLSLGLGLTIGIVGGDPVGATPRYTFGTLYLTGGIGFIPLILGLFAVSEVFIQGQRLVRGSYQSPKLSVSYPSFAEFWIPLLALGLPGGALTAMMIGVFNLHDMEVGPLIMVEAPELVWVLFASMFWASLAILILGMVESKGIVHLLRIPFTMLAPGILIFSTIGAYALRGNIFDVYTMFIAGIAGYFLRRSDYSVPAIVMGVILGQIGENSLSQALTILDYNFWGFFTEPVSAVFCGVGVLTIVWGIVRRARQYFRNNIG